MKIAVYSIAKNESHNVEKWANSNKDADLVIVCDTGSTDNTVELLEKNGVVVHKSNIDPWRFDSAKNLALSYVPEDFDIVISQDMDEELLPGWREELEKIWSDDATIVNHKYRNNGKPWQWHSKIHNRKHCKWVGIVHETLEWDIEEKQLWTDKIFLDEKQDFSKDRTFYLSLLEKKIEEGYRDWRTYYFLGNDYEVAGDIENAIKNKISSYMACEDEGLIKAYVSLNIARIYSSIKDQENALKWFDTSINHSDEKENWFYYAKYLKDLEKFKESLDAAEKCISIVTRRDGFTFDPNAWSNEINDIAALSAHYDNQPSKAVFYGQKAIEGSPLDNRLKQNMFFYREKNAKNIKIAVYTIALNENQFVERWYNSVKDADYLLIADTGSTDGTIESAKKLGINVVDVKVSPWRFDDARNAAMSALPLDVDYCLSLDMDEIVTEGWREAIEYAYINQIDRPLYKHIWSWNPDGTPGLEFAYDHIHTRKNYRWKHPVHETLYIYGKQENRRYIQGIETHHHPDHTKSRSQYLPLLKMSVDESPDDARNSFYYARELYFYGKYEDATKEFNRYLKLPGANWKPEVATAMRYLAKTDSINAEKWLLSAIEEAPGRREALVDIARFYSDKKDWAKAYPYITQALEIKEKPLEYLCEAEAWGEYPEVLKNLIYANMDQ